MAVLLKRFLRDESGSSVDEAVLATATALVVIPTAGDIGAQLAAVFETLTRALR